MNKRLSFIIQSALIAAFYTAVTYAGFGVAFGPVQFRFSESFIMLSCLTPAAIPGLTIGCLISNLGSPYGILDILLGSLATLLSALFAYFTRKVKVKGMPILSPIGSIVFNAVIISSMIAFVSNQIYMLYIYFIQIFISQTIVCYVVGIPLYYFAQKLLKRLHFDY